MWPRSVRLSGWRFLICPEEQTLKSGQCLDISTWPNVYPAPLGEMPQPPLSSGSLQRRSHMGPSWGTSCRRSRALDERFLLCSPNNLRSINTWCDQGCLCWDLVLREDRRSGRRQGRSGEGSRRGRWSTCRAVSKAFSRLDLVQLTSKHWHCHIFSGTRHRSRTPGKSASVW